MPGLGLGLGLLGSGIGGEAPPVVFEEFQVADGVGGFETFQVSDGVGGFEDFLVKE